MKTGIFGQLKSVILDQKFYLSLFCGGLTLAADLLIIKLLSVLDIFSVGSVVTLAFLFAIVINFSLQRILVFKKDKGLAHSFSLFFLYWTIGSLVNLVLVFIGLALLENVYLAQIGASVVLSIISFIAYGRFVFGGEHLGERFPFLKNKNALVCAYIFAGAFLVRAIVQIILYAKVGEISIVWGDSLRYLGNAQSFLENGSFSFKGMIEAYRTPGYPFFLAIFLFFKIPIPVIALIQSAISAILPVFVFLLSVRLGLKSKWAISAAIFTSLEPLTVYYSTPLLPDVIFTVALIVSAYLIIKYSESKSFKWLLISALIFGVLNYIRQVGVYLVFIFVLYILLQAIISKRNFSKAITHSIFFALIVAAMALPWYLRNYSHYGVASFSSALPVNFFNYVGVGTLAAQHGREYEPTRIDLMNEFKNLAPVPEDQKNLKNADYLISKTIEIVKEHPKSYAKTVLAGLNTLYFSGNYHYILYKFGFIEPPEKITSYSLIWSSEGFGGLIKKLVNDLSSPYVLIALLGKIFWLAIVAMSIIGAVILRNKRESHVFLLLMFYFAMTILSVGIGVEARHRFPLNPLIFAFAFVTINRVYEKRFGSRTGF